MVVQSPHRVSPPPRADSSPLLISPGSSNSNLYHLFRSSLCTRFPHVTTCRALQLAFLTVSVLICLVIYTTVRGGGGPQMISMDEYSIVGEGSGAGGAKTSEKKRKVILFWTQWFDKPFSSLWGSGATPFLNRCPKSPEYSNCELVEDRIRIKEADAVVFHIPDLISKVSFLGGYDVPSFRSSNQRYVFYNQESPVHTLTRLSAFADFFNWTMTYRRDSDIWAPYATFKPKGDAEKTVSDSTKPELPRITASNALDNKTGWVAWVVSRCFTHSRREQYIDNLRKHIPVDVYGRCGSRPCGNACFNDIATRYRFYVSIENSLCTDYVTEKFFSRMQELNAVLIVLQPNNASGTIRDNYANIAPPNSYIDATKFGSPRALAGYLRAVGSEPAMFSSFFTWRNNMTIKRTEFEPFCDLCKELQEADKPKKTYSDIREWWVGGTKRKEDSEPMSQPHCSPGARFTADGTPKYPPFAVPYFIHIMGS